MIAQDDFLGSSCSLANAAADDFPANHHHKPPTQLNHHQPGPSSCSSSGALAVLSLIEMDGLSYEEYFKRVGEMVESVRQFWRLEQPVKALKVLIQLAKLLADAGQLRLFARKYKMITDILDEFGRLVYANIQAKARGLLEEMKQQALAEAASKPMQYNTFSPAGPISPTAKRLQADEEASCLVLAKDICRDWFLKVGSIREMVPRFYLELAILKVYDILLNKTSNISSNFSLNEEQFYSRSLKRLTKAAWAFGDPIVAIHARAYLCKVAQRLINWNESERNANSLFEVILLNLESSARMIGQLNSFKIQTTLAHQNLDTSVLFELLSNALQAIVNLVSLRPDVYNDHDDRLSERARVRLSKMFECLMTEASRENCSNLAKNIMLHAALRALPGDIVAGQTDEILDTIEETHRIWREFCQLASLPIVKQPTETLGDLLRPEIVNNQPQCELQMIGFSLYANVGSLAVALDTSEAFEFETNLEKKVKLFVSVDAILEDLLRHEVTVENNPISCRYLVAFRAWFSYANHYLTSGGDLGSADKMLASFVLRIKRNRQHIGQQVAITELIKILFSSRKSLSGFREIVVQLSSFSQLLELLVRDEHKLEAARWILESVRANLKLNKQQEKETVIEDKQLISFLLKLAGLINESLNLLTPEDDIENLAQLLIFFLNKVTFQDKREHLDFFSRCRGTLGNLNFLLEYLARETLQLATGRLAKLERKRTARRNFLNGCLAFTFTTIPAINSPSSRLDLYLEGAQLALSEVSLSLGDYYLRQALVNVTDQVRPQSSCEFNQSAELPDRIESQNNLDHRDYRSSSIYSVISNTTSPERNTSPSSLNKRLLDQVGLLLNLMLRYESHIDLKHKLTITSLIRRGSRLGEQPALIQLLNRMNVIDDDDDGDAPNWPVGGGEQAELN